MTALILGFFASTWFGWAQERPPRRWRPVLIFGSVASLTIAAIGGVGAWRNWSGDSALSDPDAMRTYLVILGVEFGVAGLGALVVVKRGLADYLAPWICFVVGVQFLPMAPVLENPGLFPFGTLLTVVAIATVPISRRSGLALSAVSGLGAGVSLLAFASIAVISIA